MAETSVDEIVELASHGAWPSVWLDDARERLEEAARRLGRKVAVHAYLDAGMGREGMPDSRALPWLEGLYRPVFQAVFAHRHRNLRRLFGGASA